MKTFLKDKKNKGFTLIELLIVIAIIGMLSSIVLASLNSARTKSRNAKRVADLKEIEKAVELYYSDNGHYPSSGSVSFEEGRCGGGMGWTHKPDYSGSNAYIPDLAPKYISVLPGDPAITTGRCYVYISSSGDDYLVFAHFGAEGDYDVNNPMIRVLSPSCNSTQNTYFVGEGQNGGRCW